jgi:hypothetical protein
MDAPQVTVSRNRSGELRAVTVVKLEGRREIHISTSKHFRGGITCVASGFEVSECGTYTTHACALGGGGGDYYKTLASEPSARATEKAIRTVHATGLANLDAVVAEARAHYAKVQA